MSIEFASDESADTGVDAPVGAEPEAAEEPSGPLRRESAFTDEDRAEIMEMRSFFEENDIPVPPEIQAEYDAMKQGDAPPPEPPQQPETDKNRQGWEKRRAGLKAEHERLRGEHSIVATENQTLRQYNEALVQTVLDLNRRISGKGGAVTTDAPQAPGEQQEPEEAPDIIDSPDRFVDLRVQKEIAPLKQVVGQLVQLLHQERQQQAQQNIVRIIAEDRDRYEKVAPGFQDRAQAWQAAYVEDLQAAGKTVEQAQTAFYQMLSAITRDAVNNNRSPVEMVDIFARRVAAGSISPTAPAAAAPAPRRGTPVSDAIAAARAAGANGVAREPSLPNSAETGDITFDRIRSSGVKPGDIKKILSKPGGEEEFWRLAEGLERDGY